MQVAGKSPSPASRGRSRGCPTASLLATLFLGRRRRRSISAMTASRDVDDPRHGAALRSAARARPGPRHLRRGRAPDDQRGVVHARDARHRYPQPTLDFERTAFPSIPIANGGTYRRRCRPTRRTCPGIDGSFGDVVSGPHAIAFTSDGSLALMVDTNSEDVLVVDAADHVESYARPPAAGPHARGHRDLARRHPRVRRRAQHRRHRRARHRRVARSPSTARRSRGSRPIRCPHSCASASTCSTRRTATSIRSRRTTGSRARPATWRAAATR